MAPVIVLSGDEDADAEFCTSIALQSSAGQGNPSRLIKASLPLDRECDLSALQGDRLLNKLDSGNHPDWLTYWGWGSQALLADRSGDLESAIEYVGKSEVYHPTDFCHTMNLAVFAMAHHERQHSDKSKAALPEASQLITSLHDKPEDRGHHDLLIAEILIRESEAEINGRTDSAAEPSTPLKQPATRPAGERSKPNAVESEINEGSPEATANSR